MKYSVEMNRVDRVREHHGKYFHLNANNESRLVKRKGNRPVKENCSSRSGGKSMSRPTISFSKPGA